MTRSSTSRTTRLLPALGIVAAAGALLGAAGLSTTRDGVPDDAAAARVGLGRLLFFDRRMSRNGLVSCATCHDPAFAYCDRRVLSIGAGDDVNINAPTLANVASRSSWRAAGGAASLAEHARGALLNLGEVGAISASFVERRLDAVEGYHAWFAAAYGEERPTFDHVVDAIVAFESTIESRDSAYDRYERGEGTLSEEELRGMVLFFGRARCAECHSGRDFTDELYHATGSTELSPESLAAGRSSVTGSPDDVGKIRTPTLREVARTAPYFHNGALATLDDVVRFYADGGRSHRNRDARIAPISLSADERHALVAFLGTLSGKGWVDTPPVRLPE